MSSFQFSLQKVLNVKEKNKEQEEYRYMEFFNHYLAEKEYLQRLIREKQSIEEKMVSGQLNGVRVSDIHHTQSYIAHLTLTINGQEKKLDKLYSELELKQKMLLEIKKEVKIWDNLKEKKREEFNLEENRNEQKELDDIASLRSFR